MFRDKFRFFEKMPEEITLKIFRETSLGDQARLAQVDKKFNRIANDNSLEWAEYKLQHSFFERQIRNTCLVVIPVQPRKYYDLYTTENGKTIDNSSMQIDLKTFDALLAKNKEGINSLIKYLKTFGETGSLNANVLERAVKQEEQYINEIQPVCSLESGISISGHEEQYINEIHPDPSMGVGISISGIRGISGTLLNEEGSESYSSDEESLLSEEEAIEISDKSESEKEAIEISDNSENEKEAIEISDDEIFLSPPKNTF